MLSDSYALSTEKFLHMDEELRLAVRLLKSGLAALWSLDGANDFYYLSWVLLASGYERLMKCILCFTHKARRGEFPDDSYLKGLGHDINELLDRVLDECFTDEYVTSCQAAEDDRDYLRDDQLLRKLWNVLSEFGQQGRYYNLRVICGAIGPREEQSPEQAWSRIELEVMADRLSTLQDPASCGAFYEELASRLTVPFERVARALARLFTLADIHPDAQRFTGTIGHFLFLRDLGEHDYRQEKIW